jgi:hypothetical protein
MTIQEIFEDIAGKVNVNTDKHPAYIYTTERGANLDMKDVDKTNGVIRVNPSNRGRDVKKSNYFETLYIYTIEFLLFPSELGAEPTSDELTEYYDFCMDMRKQFVSWLMGTKSLIDVTVTDFNEIQYDKYDEGSVGYDITFETGLREGTLTFKCH